MFRLWKCFSSDILSLWPDSRIYIGPRNESESRLNLSMHGKMLRERASQIVQLEEAAQIDIRGKTGTPAVSMAGPEVLLARFGSTKTHPIETILQIPFVSPNSQILGRVGASQSLDGWSEDKFPRHIKFSSSSLRLIEEIVSRGEPLAYLPDYIAESYIKRKDWFVLKISGCPYSCKQRIKLVARKPIELSWLKQVF